MPLRSKGLHYRIRNRLSALLTFRAVSMRMTIHAPRVSVFLHKWCAGVEWIATLRAKEVPSMPLGSTGYYHFSLDRRLARLATRREHLVKVKVAEEALRLVCAVFGLEPCHVIGVGMCVEESNIFAALACANT